MNERLLMLSGLALLLEPCRVMRGVVSLSVSLASDLIER